MANICNNTFYAYSKDSENIKAIVNFFNDEWSADIEEGEDCVNVYFDSKWVFPENDMCNLLNSIPNKDDIYMRCLSVEYGLNYVAYWKCYGDYWYQEV